MPKKKRTPVVPPLTRLRSARQRKERSQQLLVTAIGVVIVAVVVGLTAFGVYLSQRGPGGTSALKVGDTSFSTDYVLRRVKLLAADTATQGQPAIPQSVLIDAVTAIEEEEVIRQEADSLGIFADPEEVEAKIGERIGISRDDPKAYKDALKAELNRIGLSEKEFRLMIEGQLLREKVETHFEQNTPTSTDQARVRQIILVNQADAQNALRRLEQGEDFATVAKEVSQDQGTKDAGGEAGWVPRGMRGEAFDKTVFALEPGQRSGVISEDGFFSIVQVHEKASNRELAAEQRTALSDRLFQDWLSNAVDTVGIILQMDQAKINWVIDRAFPQNSGG